MSSVVKFELFFEKQLLALQETPWHVLELKILDDLYARIEQDLPLTHRKSYLRELAPYLVYLLQTIASAGDSNSHKFQSIDPVLLERVLNQLSSYSSGNEKDMQVIPLSRHTRQEITAGVVMRVAQTYLRLDAFEKLIVLLERYGFWQANETFGRAVWGMDGGQSVQHHREIFLQKFYGGMAPDFRQAFTESLGENGFKSSERTVTGLFVIGSEGYFVGILGRLTLTDLRVSRRLGVDQVRIATHLVDESDALADQTKALCAYLRRKHSYQADDQFRLEYSIDQPSTLLVGNSAGLAMTVLGSMGLYMYRRNRSLQPMVYHDVAFTGGVDENGEVLPVDEECLHLKIEAAFFGPVCAVVVPAVQVDVANSAVEGLRKRYPHRELSVVPISHAERLEERREVIHLQRRKVRERVGQFVREYANSMTYGIMGFILLLAAGFYWGIVKYPVPDSANSEGDRVVVKNKYGFTLWESGIGGSIGRVYDIDDDGTFEILISYGQKATRDSRGKLVCYTAEKSIVWKVHLGGVAKYGDNTHSDFFTISSIYIDDLDENGNYEIVAVIHAGFFPNQLLIISSDGEIISEYWHAGGISEAIIVDIIPDNEVKEILLCGRNNEYKSGVLVLIDPFRIEGQSPQTAHYYTKEETELGNEIFYVRFPNTHFSLPSKRDVTKDISLNDDKDVKVFLENGRIIKSHGYIVASAIYIFDSKLHVKFLDIADTYYHLYGLVFPNLERLPYNDPELINYFRAVDYWDGEKWVKEPTMNRKYLETLESEP